MTELFQKFISENNLPITGRALLLGVSGGIDSMVMLHLMRSSGFKISVAHCNFSLRGRESDLDESFVAGVCKSYGIDFHSTRFDTISYARNMNISVQMAARDLRYEWFEMKRAELNLDYTCIAHNKNDVVETFIINLSRGTGLNGLTGIKCINGTIIRPLLFATRRMIQDYAIENNITYREDSSNSETKYLRNRVRHLILPQFLELNSNAVSSIDETIKRLSDAYEILSATIGSVREELFIKDNEAVQVSRKSLLGLRPLKTYLYELFSYYGITPGQVDDLTELLNSKPGKMVITPGYRIFSDRDNILVVPTADNNHKEIILIDEGDLLKYNDLFRAQITGREQFKPVNQQSMAWIDADSVSYPLVIRKWKPGDWFYPFGLKGKKKISDLLIDLKVPVYKKENIMILLSGNDIAWIIGIRSDNRFRITNKSSRIIELKANS